MQQLNVKIDNTNNTMYKVLWFFHDQLLIFEVKKS